MKAVALGTRQGERSVTPLTSKLTRSKEPAWLRDLNEGFHSESTPSKPVFDSQPQRISQFTGSRNRAGIPLLRSRSAGVEEKPVRGRIS